MSVLLKVALGAYFEHDVLNVDWRGPEGEDEKARELDLSHETLIYDYYEPFLSVLAAGDPVERDGFKAVRLFHGDAIIGVDGDVL